MSNIFGSSGNGKRAHCLIDNEVNTQPLEILTPSGWPWGMPKNVRNLVAAIALILVGVSRTFSVRMSIYSADMGIHINEDGLSDAYRQIADRIKKVDTELRSRLTSSDVQNIKPEAQQALAKIGVALPESDLDRYSQSIADNTDYRIILK